MLMNEVREKTGLTRKAIEYYEEKGFISPERESNNYRIYTDEEVDILKKISIYRKLGCSIEEIEGILQEPNKSSLATIIRDREIKSQLDNKRVEILKLLLEGLDINTVKEQLILIDQQESIYSKLVRAFPGYIGQIFFLSYKAFLTDTLKEDKIKYYEDYIEFLDTMPDFELDEDEKIAIDQASKTISLTDIEEVNEEKTKAIYNADEWLEENKEMLERYQSFKESSVYLNNPIYRIQEKMKKHMQDSGYYEKAIPLMKKFSPAYNDYYEELLAANQKLIDKNI
ncbi:MerR family transcriptional regulator [Facklamia sp. P12934]|uniref:MerR family transcriptional regulator n=1 Tax=unclassified Facklamia TaxID=2622293 RepID=UPI003D182EDB